MALCGILAGIIFYNVDHSFDGVQNRLDYSNSIHHR